MCTQLPRQFVEMKRKKKKMPKWKAKYCVSLLKKVETRVHFTAN